jgi:hypothetical protein
MLGAIANLHPGEQSRLDDDNIKHKMRGRMAIFFSDEQFQHSTGSSHT